jgi:ATP-dependent DNA helicase
VLSERVRALAAMVAYGVDEETVTLTFLDGIGGTLARRLRDVGVTDIEALAICDAEELARVRGVSAARAARWIAEATNKIKTRSAFSLHESGRKTQASTGSWPSHVDPYRLRRALELKVCRQGDGFVVSGGLEPHRVTSESENLACDCADFAKGHTCKHVLAARLHRKDAQLFTLVERLSSQPSAGSLDLFHLWFDGGKR